LPRSLPALAAGILQTDKAWRVRSDVARLAAEPLPPVYYVDETLAVAAQAERVAQAVAELAQKLARLQHAYPAWPLFDPGAYFDLQPCHLASLSRVEETRNIVRVRLYADLLAPAFRAAERYWVGTFLPAYHAGSGSDALDAFRGHLYVEAAPTLARLLDEATGVTQDVLDLLAGNLEVVSLLGGLEERIQHRPRPGTTLAPGLPTTLQRLPRAMPTLTLDLIFPAPVERPVGREVWLDFATASSGLPSR
jgi:hypothetical protein